MKPNKHVLTENNLPQFISHLTAEYNDYIYKKFIDEKVVVCIPDNLNRTRNQYVLELVYTEGITLPEKVKLIRRTSRGNEDIVAVIPHWVINEITKEDKIDVSTIKTLNDFAMKLHRNYEKEKLEKQILSDLPILLNPEVENWNIKLARNKKGQIIVHENIEIDYNGDKVDLIPVYHHDEKYGFVSSWVYLIYRYRQYETILDGKYNFIGYLHANNVDKYIRHVIPYSTMKQEEMIIQLRRIAFPAQLVKMNLNYLPPGSKIPHYLFNSLSDKLFELDENTSMNSILEHLKWSTNIANTPFLNKVDFSILGVETDRNGNNCLMVEWRGYWDNIVSPVPIDDTMVKTITRSVRIESNESLLGTLIHHVEMQAHRTINSIIEGFETLYQSHE